MPIFFFLPIQVVRTVCISLDICRLYYKVSVAILSAKGAPVDGSFPILTVVRSFVDIRHTKSMRIKRAITTVWSFFI